VNEQLAEPGDTIVLIPRLIGSQTSSIRCELVRYDHPMWLIRAEGTSTLIQLHVDDWVPQSVEKAKPKPELPSEPWSYYLDKYGANKGAGNIWFTDGKGLLHSWPEGSNPEKYAPFVRMEMPSVTAKAVLHKVRGIFGPGALLLDEVKRIEAEFGVTT
jgi:hypothetical protein